jgi:ABC-2 type transport system permease protein
MKARVFLWSVRREAWENRSVYLAPLLISALLLAGFLVAGLNHGLNSRVPPRFAAIPFSLAASVILVTGWLVGVLYAADALYGDRRDRSILFWKSMPVPDWVTVLSKASVALIVIPFLSTVAAFATQLVMLVASSIIMSSAGDDASFPWRVWPIASQTLVMLYGVAIHILWFAPIYSWFILVSACAPRGPLLTAVLPIVALFAAEKLAFGSSWLLASIQYRITGAVSGGFTRPPKGQSYYDLSQLDPARFFSNPDLWLGLVVAALFLGLAVWRRRYSQPI